MAILWLFIAVLVEKPLATDELNDESGKVGAVSLWTTGYLVYPPNC